MMAAVGWTSVCPPDLYVEARAPTVLGGGAFGRWLGHEGGLMNDISHPWGLTKRQERACFLSSLRTHPPFSPPCESTMRGWLAICKPGSRPSLDTGSAGALTLDFQPPEPWEINVCLSRPVYGNLLQQPSSEVALWGTTNVNIQRSGFKAQPETGAEVRTCTKRGLEQRLRP